MAPDTGLVWFRRDLRLDDNPAWAGATAAHDRVVALYVLDGRLLDPAGPHRRRQLLADLAALRARLRTADGDLLVRHGRPEWVVAAEASRWSATAVHWNADVTPFATGRDRLVREGLDVPARETWGTLVLPPGSVLTNDGHTSRVFTPFHRRWRDTPWEPWAAPGGAAVVDESGDDLPAPGGDPPRPAGEDGARWLLESFLDEEADDYGDGRDDVGTDRTSHLSVALRFGTISPREVVELVGEEGDGRAAFTRQLAWRELVRAHLLHEIPSLPDRALREKYDGVAWRDDPDGLAAWREGRTGYPIVDAGMRELAATGYVHNRVRMIVGSFLVKDLLIDWRRGERHFRHLLADGDVAQNVGNWQWVAGTGADAAPWFRIFNPVTQSRRHDPRGDYLRRWVPELAALDDDAIHAPWEAGPLELEAAGVTLGGTYPAPIVDHTEARERTLAAYRAVG